MAGPADAPLRLPALAPPAALAHWRETLAALPGASLRLADALPLPAVLAALAPLRPLLHERLGPAPQVLVRQCWVRRGLPPHHWHQDGALHFDFIAQPAPPPDALLPIWTCWLPLRPCGVDAPGLEWIDAPPGRLLAPAELDDAALRRRWPGAAFVHPPLDAGAALLFDGALLHRTHWQPAMTRPRTSIELRFIAAGATPPRLAAEPLLPWK